MRLDMPFSTHILQGLIWHFFAEGEILVCGSIPKVGDLGVCSPRKFMTSESGSEITYTNEKYNTCHKLIEVDTYFLKHRDHYNN